MAERQNRKAKQEIAKALYLTNKYPQKDIAKMVGVNENTLSRWAKDGSWELLRANLTTTPEQVLAGYYAQLAEINKNIELKPDGHRYASGSELKTIASISGAIKKMQMDTGVGEVISVCTCVCEFVRKYDVGEAQRISDHFNAYIEFLLK